MTPTEESHEATEGVAENLRHQLNFTRTITDNIGEGVCAVDREGRITFMNPAAQRMLGWAESELLGRNMHEAIHFQRGDGARVRVEDCPLLGVLGSGVTYTSDEDVFTRKDRQMLAVAYTSSPVVSDGEIVGAVLAFRDISKRKLAEEAQAERVRLASLNANVGVALTEGNTLQDMLRRCTEALVQQLNAAFARIWTLNKSENVLELQASSGMYTHLDGPHARVPVGKFKIGLIAEERQPHLTNSVIGDSRVSDQEWARRERMVAFAGYPLIVEDRLVGVVAMFTRHALTKIALEAMSSIANGIALGIERKHAEEELRSAHAEMEKRVAERTAELSDANAILEQQIAERRRVEEELQKEREFLSALLDNLAEGIVACDADGTLTLFNRATREFHGLPEEALPAEGWAGHYDLYLPDGTTPMKTADIPLFRALQGQSVRDVEMVIAPKNGAPRTLLANGQMIIDGDGGKLGAVVAMHDITERKRAEGERAQFIRAQIARDQMLEELSTPVVPVWHGVLVLPIIGSLDTERMERATAAALREVTRTGAHVCIIDITGARIVDSHAVSNLGNLAGALRLIGAEAIVTGIGAHAAQTLVGLGVDLTEIRTHRTLAEALAMLIQTSSQIRGESISSNGKSENHRRT